MSNITTSDQIKTWGKMYVYPNGMVDIIGATKPIFKPDGWEDRTADKRQRAPRPRKSVHDASDIDRAKCRARANVRRLALANVFRYFVTLTYDPARVDSMDPVAVVRQLNSWCNNQVTRRGLKYVLVPEYHKSGRIHFHGFFNDALPVVDSGTIKRPGHKRPCKPRSNSQREAWIAEGGKIVYNLPAWSCGFTTALELWGNYPAAVAYVCKYIGKDSQKIGGRWYYSGGKLDKPVEKFVDISAQDIASSYDNAWIKYVPGGVFAGVNGVGQNE